MAINHSWRQKQINEAAHNNKLVDLVLKFPLCSLILSYQINCFGGSTWSFWAADMFELQLLDIIITQATRKALTQQKYSNIRR